MKGVLTMGKPIDANGTQASLDWSQINWRKVEKTVLRLQHRIFMAKVNGENLCLGHKWAQPTCAPGTETSATGPR